MKGCREKVFCEHWAGYSAHLWDHLCGLRTCVAHYLRTKEALVRKIPVEFRERSYTIHNIGTTTSNAKTPSSTHWQK